MSLALDYTTYFITECVFEFAIIRFCSCISNVNVKVLTPFIFTAHNYLLLLYP